MKIIINEITGIIKNKTVIWIWIVLSLINFCVLYYSEDRLSKETLCTSEKYSVIYDEIKGMDNSTAYAYLCEKTDYYNNTADAESIFMLLPYSTVLAEVKQCAFYNEYLEQVQADADKYGKISIFSEGNLYGMKNVKKTAKAFEALQGNQLSCGPSRGINLLTGTFSMDIIAVFMIFAAAAALVMKEKEDGVRVLTSVCSRGRIHLAAGKISGVFFACIITVILIYLPSGIFVGIKYGFGDTNRLIQSVEGFVASNLTMSVGQYLICFILAKLAVLFMFAVLFVFIMSISDSAGLVYIITAAVMGAETALYYSIGNSSAVMALKNINLYAFINTERIFRFYMNIRVFGEPINYFVASFIGIAVLTLLFMAGFIISFTVRKSISHTGKCIVTIKNFFGQTDPWNRIYGTNLLLNEWYKIFIKNKVLLIIILAAVFLRYTYTAPNSVYSSVEDVYYMMAVKEVEGDYSDKKIEYINGRIKAIEEGTSGVQAGTEHYWLTAYNSLLKKGDKMSDTEGAVFMYDRGYCLITGGDTNHELELGIESAILLIVSVFGIWTVEYFTGMNALINPSGKGKKIVGLIKLLTGWGIAVIIYMGVHIPWYYGILNKFGKEYLYVPAKILEHLSWLPANISITEYIIGISVIKTAVMWCMVVLVSIAAKKFKSPIMTVVASAVVCILPLLVLRILGGI
ncbi:MAG: hypothetical protein ACI4EN_03015 [Butyrivibrio sp.]